MRLFPKVCYTDVEEYLADLLRIGVPTSYPVSPRSPPDELYPVPEGWDWAALPLARIQDALGVYPTLDFGAQGTAGAILPRLEATGALYLVDTPCEELIWQDEHGHGWVAQVSPGAPYSWVRSDNSNFDGLVPVRDVRAAYKAGGHPLDVYPDEQEA